MVAPTGSCTMLVWCENMAASCPNWLRIPKGFPLSPTEYCLFVLRQPRPMKDTIITLFALFFGISERNRGQFSLAVLATPCMLCSILSVLFKVLKWNDLIGQPICRPSNRPTNRPTLPPTVLPSDPPTDRSTYQPYDRSTNRSITNWQTDRPAWLGYR